jgi:TonB-linked SusC/RagA family outer membrane protein
MKKVLLSFLMIVLVTFSGYSQVRTIDVTGKVTGGSDGMALPGVTVVIKGTNVGTTTDIDGKFTIKVSDEKSILVFSYIGFENLEQAVGSRSTINVALKESVAQLGEVVVTALGIQRETKALQYSISTIDGAGLTEARENNLANQLAGRVAGVNVTNVASGPAGSSRVIIRGNKSLQGENQPLYVIDGIPMDNSNFGQAGVWGGTDRGDGMSSINPDDIESISVLKGASAAALYGARAAYGVILITTKRGNNRKGIGIEYNSNYVFERINNQTDLQTTYGSGRYQTQTDGSIIPVRPTTARQGYDWGTQAWGPRLGSGKVVHFDGVERDYVHAGNNWNRFYETGTAFTNSISLTGGGANQNFRFNITDLKNNSVVPNAGFDRLNTSIATNGKFGNKLMFDAKVLYSNEKARNRPFLSDSPNNAFQSIFALPPDVNIEWGKGDPDKPGAIVPGTNPALLNTWGFAEREEYLMVNNPWGQNPYWATHQVSVGDTRDRVLGSGSMRYDITDFLYVSGRVGMDWFSRREHSLIPMGTGHTRGGNMSEATVGVREINLEAIVGFRKDFGPIGVNAFVGSNRMRRSWERIAANGNGFNVPFFHAINNAAIRNYDYGYSASGINSAFGSAEISYNNYLFITATARNDWFSVLNPENNSILYPSIGGSFVFSDAFAGLPTWLSFGKLRASWAQVGSVSVAPYQVENFYRLMGAQHLGRPMAEFASGSSIPNPNLLPLLSTETEIGGDMRFFGNRLGLDITYYRQITTNDQVNAQISRASGFNSTQVNVGELRNQGIEMLVTGTPVKGAVQWDVSVNFARNRNEVISLSPGAQIMNVDEPRTRTVFVQHRVGQPFGVIAGWVQKRDPNGNLVFEQNGSPVQSNQMEIIGNGIPDWTGGINNSFTYKGINLSFLVDVRLGGNIYSGTNLRLTQWGLHKQSLQGREGEEPLKVKGVTQTGTVNGQPVYEPFEKTLTPNEARLYWNNMGNRVQDHFIYDGSFAKLRQISLGYNIPRKLLDKTPFENLNVSFVGRNLSILWKNIENVDPESAYSSGNAQGLEMFGMPQTRSYGFNLRATF